MIGGDLPTLHYEDLMMIDWHRRINAYPSDLHGVKGEHSCLILFSAKQL